jgi:hypothetical protein
VPLSKMRDILYTLVDPSISLLHCDLKGKTQLA